jgi:cell wall-associated NlpC family hydrolase
LAKSTQPIDANKLSNFIEQEIVARESKTAMSSADSRLIDDLLTEANKHIGKPYVHGAKGPSAFDCSGFSSYVYRQFGYKISPASRVQATEGEPVAAGDLRKGDLVFFTSRSSGGNVGHVGIVVSADNANGTFKFIHASIKGVKISECEGYYKNRYLGARRIINSSK